MKREELQKKVLSLKKAVIALEQEWITKQATAPGPGPAGTSTQPGVVDLLALHNAKVAAANLEADMEKTNLDRLSRRIEDKRDLAKRLEVEESKGNRADEKRWVLDSSKSIAWLEKHCDQPLLDDLKTCDEYQEAVSRKDPVKAREIAKMACLDADTDNVKERNYERQNELMNCPVLGLHDFSDWLQDFSA